MNKIKNNKFKNIVQILKKNKKNLILDSIQKNAVFEMKKRINNKVNKNLYKFYHNISCNKIEKKNIVMDKDVSIDKFDNILDDLSDKNLKLQNNISKKSNSNNYEEVNVNTKTHKSIKSYSHMNLSKLDAKYHILEIIKSKKDNYSDIIFNTLDPIYRTIKENRELLDYQKQYKLKTIDIFNKQNFYNKYEYNVKDFKKADLNDIFVNNKHITLNMMKVYCDVLNVNLVYQHLDESLYYFKFMNNFIHNRVTILIFENSTKLFSIIDKNKSFIRGNELLDFLKITMPIKESDLNKLKLDKLQNYSRMHNLCIKKKGKVGKINKLKEELIHEILLNY